MERKFDSMKQVAIFVTFAGFSRKMTDITGSVSFGRFPVRPLWSPVGYLVTGEVAKKLHDKRNPMLFPDTFAPQRGWSRYNVFPDNYTILQSERFNNR